MSESSLIHHKEKSHNILIENLKLKHIVYNRIKLKTLDDNDISQNEINKFINSLQKFLKSHLGFKRDELQSYLDLFV